MYLRTTWNGKLYTLPKAISGRTRCHYGSENNASESSRLFRSMNITAILADGPNVNITHVIIKGSTQWIVGRNVTTKCNIIHNNSNYLKLPDGSRIPLQTDEFHSYMPHEKFSKKGDSPLFRRNSSVLQSTSMILRVKTLRLG